jgi:glycosyltransferase involved in cell wall biosynthesis
MLFGRKFLKYNVWVARGITLYLVCQSALFGLFQILWSPFRSIWNLISHLKRLPAMYRVERGIGLSPSEKILWAQERGKVQIDFIGPVETYWSISVVNRATLNGLLSRGVNVALFNQAARRWLLKGRMKDRWKRGEVNDLLLPKEGLAPTPLSENYSYLTRKRRKKEIVFFGYVDLINPREFGKFNMGWVVFETAPIPPLYARLIKRLDLVLVPTHFVKELCVESGIEGSRVEVFPHCVDFSEFNPERADSFQKKDGLFRFLNIGLDHFKQGRDLLLEAYFSEFDASEPVILQIKGGTLAQKARKLQPHETIPISEMIELVKERVGKSSYPRVELIGEKEITDIVQLYGQANCSVSPFYSNGFAMTILESMACARPAIVPRFGGLLDYCNDENTFLIEIDEMIAAREKQYYCDDSDISLGFFAKPSLKSLRQKMRQAFKDPIKTRELGERAHRSVRHRFSLEENPAIFEEILRRRVPSELLGKRARDLHEVKA